MPTHGRKVTNPDHPDSKHARGHNARLNLAAAVTEANRSEHDANDSMCESCPAKNEPLGVPCPYLLEGEDCPTPDMVAGVAGTEREGNQS